jgi:phosphate transport system substrate-binding protein
MKKAFIFAAVAAITLLAAMVFTSCKKETTYHAVTLDANGGTLVGDATVTVPEGEKMPLPYDPTPPEKRAFTGWFRDAAAMDEWIFSEDVVTGDMTLYAGWEPVYTVTFHANGGTFASSSKGGDEVEMDFTGGSLLSVPQNVKRDGYVLEGWYRDEALTGRWDFSFDVVTADGDLYAKWGEGIEGLTLENYPRVDGATSTRALNHMIACKLLGLSYVWQGWSETMELDVWPKNDKFGFSFDPTIFDGCIATSQTHGAMMNLIEGKADIILRSTTASPDEKAAAQAAGVTLIETPIAFDAFVFIKNRANPVQSLTLEQIRKIMTKQITDWSQVGGKKAPVTVYARPRNSGSEEALRELVMNGQEPAEFPEEQLIGSMIGVFWEINRDPNGISYIFKNYKDMIVMRSGEPVFAIDGIAPTAATMKSGTYPLTTKVYAIIRTDLDHGSTAYKLYEWLGTDAARVVLEECGFLPC